MLGLRLVRSFGCCLALVIIVGMGSQSLAAEPKWPFSSEGEVLLEGAPFGDPCAHSAPLEQLDGPWVPGLSGVDVSTDRKQILTNQLIGLNAPADIRATRKDYAREAELFLLGNSARLTNANIKMLCGDQFQSKDQFGKFVLNSIFFKRPNERLIEMASIAGIQSGVDLLDLQWKFEAGSKQSDTRGSLYYSMYIGNTQVANTYAVINYIVDRDNIVIADIFSKIITERNWRSLQQWYDLNRSRSDLDPRQAIKSALSDLCQLLTPYAEQKEPPEYCVGPLIVTDPYLFSVSTEKIDFKGKLVGDVYLASKGEMYKALALQIDAENKEKKWRHKYNYLVDGKTGTIKQKERHESPGIVKAQGHQTQTMPKDFTDSCHLSSEDSSTTGCRLVWESKEYDFLTVRKHGTEVTEVPMRVKINAYVERPRRFVLNDQGGKFHNDMSTYGIAPSNSDFNDTQRSAVDAVRWLSEVVKVFAEEKQWCVLDTIEGAEDPNQDYYRCSDISVIVSNEDESEYRPTIAYYDESLGPTIYLAGADQHRSAIQKSANFPSDASDPIVVAHEYVHLLLRSINRLLFPHVSNPVFTQCPDGDLTRGEQFGALDESLADVLGSLSVVKHIRSVHQAKNKWSLFSIGANTKADSFLEFSGENVQMMPRKMDLLSAYLKELQQKLTDDYEQNLKDAEGQHGNPLPDALVRKLKEDAEIELAHLIPEAEQCGSKKNAQEIDSENYGLELIYKHAAIPNYVAYWLLTNPPTKQPYSEEDWYSKIFKLYVESFELMPFYEGIGAENMDFHTFARNMRTISKRNHEIFGIDSEAKARVIDAWLQVGICAPANRQYCKL